MIPQALFGLWVAGVTLGAVVVGQGYATPPAQADGAEHVDTGNYRYFQTDLVGAPVIADGKIVGYLIGRFTVKVDQDREAGRSELIEELVHDAANSHLIESGERINEPDGWHALTSTIEEIADRANEGAGHQPVVAEVLLDQLDYFDKDSVRMPQADGTPEVVAGE